MMKNNMYLFYAVVIFLIVSQSCQETKTKQVSIQKEIPNKQEADSILYSDSLKQLHKSSMAQIVASPDTSFDTLLQKHFDYNNAHLLATEQSMADAGLVDVLDVLPDLKIDLRYATNDNFVGEILYSDLHRCFLRIETIIKLLKAYKYLHQLAPTYSFIIFDGTRPQSVQYKMYDIVKAKGQTKYVASPEKGSLHNFGAAIDLSLYDLNTGQEVDMGTPFDFFGPEAQPRFHQQMLQEGKLTQTQIEHRLLLKQVMKKAGFIAIQTEWWHFEAFNKEYARSHFKIIP